jgi:cyclophilin family peptidyl-prolyl cis-trans isomerase
MAIFTATLSASAAPEPPYYCSKKEASFRAVDLDTLLGPIRIALYDAFAPITTENFVYYVRQGFYDNTLVHEVERRFVMQAGLYGSDFQEKKPLRPPIANESSHGITHQAMRVAMWRGADPDSATSGFFINLNDNPTLDIPQGYAVFGEVIEGSDHLLEMQYQFLCHKTLESRSHCRPILIHSAKLVDIPCETQTEARS